MLKIAFVEGFAYTSAIFNQTFKSFEYLKSITEIISVSRYNLILLEADIIFVHFGKYKENFTELILHIKSINPNAFFIAVPFRLFYLNETNIADVQKHVHIVFKHTPSPEEFKVLKNYPAFASIEFR